MFGFRIWIQQDEKMQASNEQFKIPNETGENKTFQEAEDKRRNWKPVGPLTRHYIERVLEKSVHMALNGVSDQHTKRLLTTLCNRLVSLLGSITVPPNRLGDYQELSSILKALEEEKRKCVSKKKQLEERYSELEKSCVEHEEEKRLLLQRVRTKANEKVEVPQFLQDYVSKLSLPSV
ncbi:hypothetical protein ScPMuIL_006251 [Solemya velum]